MAQKKRNYKVTNAHRSRALSMRVDRTLRAHGITPTNQSITQVSAQQFHAAISTGKQQAKHGWMVDVHTVKEYRGMRCYLTADGKSGIAIKRDGNVVSLFSAGGGGKLGKLLPFAVAAGGRKLDCFGGGLQNMYAQYGAKATGQTPFNDEYAPEGWDESEGRPPVVAMTLPRSLDELVKAYDKGATVDMSKVRVFKGDDGYDKMIDDRDRRLAQRSGGTSALGLTAG